LANGTRGSNWEPVPFLDLGFVSSVLPWERGFPENLNFGMVVFESITSHMSKI
jgi:hypothetical protein